MFLYEFEVVDDEGMSSGSLRYQWAQSEDEAFTLAYGDAFKRWDEEKVSFYDVLFQVVHKYEGILVYWMPAGAA